MKRTYRINAKRVTELRTRAGLSQKVLASKVIVHPATISRWERGEIDKVRHDTFGRLQKALSATELDLCGQGPLSERGQAPREPEKGQMNLTIDDACRNALTLVAQRYGVTRQTIVETAPLLFFLAAEQCLKERQARLEQLRKTFDVLFETRIRHLPVFWPVDPEALTSEQLSIDAQDLNGRMVAKPIEDPDWNEWEGNPFAEFLSKALTQASGSDQRVLWSADGSPYYFICRDEAAAIVGGDVKATEAILHGRAALHEMPPEVRKSSPADRAEWARREVSSKYLIALDPAGYLFDPSENSSGN